MIFTYDAVEIFDGSKEASYAVVKLKVESSLTQFDWSRTASVKID